MCWDLTYEFTLAKQRETGKAPGTPGRETEILKGLQLGNPSSTREPETKSEGRGHRVQTRRQCEAEGAGRGQSTHGSQSPIKPSGLCPTGTSGKVLESSHTIIQRTVYRRQKVPPETFSETLFQSTWPTNAIPSVLGNICGSFNSSTSSLLIRDYYPRTIDLAETFAIIYSNPLL